VTAETKAVTTETKVGAFVLACLAILTFTIAYLFNAEARGMGVHYRTYLRYAGGLDAGSDVLFGGIEAGKITAVRPWAADPTRIEILFKVKAGIPVNEKSVAKLGSTSVMSDPALEISTGSKAARRLPPDTTIPSEEAPSLDDITAKIATVADSANGLITQAQGELGGISSDTRTLLANLNSITGPTNQKQIDALLKQTNGLLADERPKIDHIADQLLALSQHADAVIGKAGPVVDHADGAIQNANATMGDLHEPLRKDLAELQSTLNEARSLLANMQVMMRANDDKIDDTIENLRIATDNLDQLTDSLKQRPWSLIRIKQTKDRKIPQ
jgi:phospholipid/cholesterol/gamma-HCH transport system substrate-binding protein